ncbi:MAG: proline--tRNA ligase [Opitutales bacterium]|nr:proline--tRNA ligase [Opitutales bacterium]
MSKKSKTAITPTRSEDYPEWYQQVIRAADLAEVSPVRGCMVIKPWGYALWENIQSELDTRFKATGHKNAYFPLFIPLRFMQREAEHVEGFAKECAVVTHSRLEAGEDGQLTPAGPLEEPLIVRPTSETIIGELFAKWVQSYRDLPLLINQWANVVRWEMRTRLFLRTTEFLWQEGHTVHANSEEAMEETQLILDLYADFAENYMAMPVIKGEKTEGERFPGALNTYSIEAMMQDRKALQAGTSHFLGQNFSKASNIQYLDKEGQKLHAWTTSWGVSTRLVGGLIMTHADDNGMVCPPKLAPAHVVILPVTPKEETRNQVLEHCDKLAREIRDLTFDGKPIRVEFDDRDLRGGEKMWQWVKKGIPLTVEVGPRDLEGDSVFVGRRDNGPQERAGMPRVEFINSISTLLQEIQDTLLQRAMDFKATNTVKIDTEEDFYEFFTPKNKESGEIHGGFVLAHWAYDPATEERLQKDLKVSIRCIPEEREGGPGTCPFTGQPSEGRVVFAKAY